MRAFLARASCVRPFSFEISLHYHRSYSYLLLFPTLDSTFRVICLSCYIISILKYFARDSEIREIHEIHESRESREIHESRINWEEKDRDRKIPEIKIPCLHGAHQGRPRLEAIRKLTGIGWRGNGKHGD